MKTILLCFDDDTFTPDELARVHAQADGYEVLLTKDRAAIEAKLDDVEIAAGAFPRDLLGRASNLRWWQQWGAGADWLLNAPEVRAMEFTLTNTSGIHAIQISEHIFAFLLAFGRNLPQAMDAQREHIWVSNHWQASHSSTIRPGQKFNYYISHQAVFELAGKTMVLVGVGAIGLRTARLAQAFDLRVIGVRRHADRALPHVDRVVGPDDLHSVLPEADFVVVTAPLTPETAGMFDAAAFAAMQPSAYFVNIGRGGTVVEPDLIAALQSGAIAGAGLDVFAEEPLPPESPLWDLPNVIITSHYSGLSPEYDARALEIFLDNLHRYRTGEPMTNVVDKRLVY